MATPAGADVRSLSIADPQDGTPTVSGQPSSPDISRVSATYNSAGSLTLQIGFFNDAATVDRSQNYAFWSQFVVSGWGGTPAKRSCTASMPGGLNGQHHVYADSTTFFDRATVTGMDGFLSFTRTSSADNRTITLSASGPALANRDYRCLSYQSMTRRRSTVENPNSYYDEGCGCWYVPLTLDFVSPAYQYDAEGVSYFDGYAPPAAAACENGLDDDGDLYIDYADPDCSGPTDTSESAPPPPPPTACANGRDDDGDGHTDLTDPGCRGQRSRTAEGDPAPVASRLRLSALARRCRVKVVAVETLPDLAPGRLFPFARVVVRVTGPRYKRTRRLKANTGAEYTFKVKRKGRYRIRAGYPGDQWRTRSRTRSYSVRVRACRVASARSSG